MNANYTWGHAISDAPEVSTYDCDGVIEDPTDRNRDRSISCIDRPSAFTLSGDFQPTWHGDSKWLHAIITNNDFTPTIVAESGIPQSIIASSPTPLNGDSTATSYQRPLFVPRNSVRGPSITQVDLRYTRTLGTWFEYFRPQLFVESNNLFNKHSNITTLNTTTITIPRHRGRSRRIPPSPTRAHSSKPASCSLERSSSSRIWSGNPVLNRSAQQIAMSRGKPKGAGSTGTAPPYFFQNRVISA